MKNASTERESMRNEVPIRDHEVPDQFPERIRSSPMENFLPQSKTRQSVFECSDMHRELVNERQVGAFHYPRCEWGEAQ
jgi:hypothetical protein